MKLPVSLCKYDTVSKKNDTFHNTVEMFTVAKHKATWTKQFGFKLDRKCFKTGFCFVFHEEKKG